MEENIEKRLKLLGSVFFKYWYQLVRINFFVVIMVDFVLC